MPCSLPWEFRREYDLGSELRSPIVGHRQTRLNAQGGRQRSGMRIAATHSWTHLVDKLWS